MKHYFVAVFNVLFTVATFGVIMPFLISYADTLLVAFGFAWLFVIYVPVMYYVNRNYAVQLFNKLKGMQ